MSNKSLQGACMCGAIQFKLKGLPKKSAICHCLDCQKSAGSAFQTSSVYAASDVDIIDPEGHLKKYVVPGNKVGSGHEKHKYFCDVCGCPVYNMPMKEEGKIMVIKTGLIDAEEGKGGLHAYKELKPQAELFTRSRANYLSALNNVDQFDTGFTPTK
ncbi:Mss4-like protein [Gilbertella persicaria]|uniref:CENP-V/GFA domain-containing protein n=1 Tax=Rhizopus stolonifer TaxID=4846 RepID=A0A367JPV6_RHIST|nr:Mss4-like protein [Gilbertella persicaria]KAI8069852.1 Mss4-like protein [Gilbertella persicaria]RCH91980.1 hypothetical protein CU098_010786 [Rhizopus stolonifer]